MHSLLEWAGRRLTGVAAVLVLVGFAQSTAAQELILKPAQGEAPGNAQPFLDACLNLNAWGYTKNYTTYLGTSDHALVAKAQADPFSVATCFQNMNSAGSEAGAGCSRA